MAIQPIDLSTMYSQMDNVAKFNVAQTQGAQIATQVKNEKLAEMQFQQNQAVKETAKNSDSRKVRPDGHQGGEGAFASDGKKKDGENAEEEEEVPESKGFSDPSLGQHIDIMG